MEANLKLSYVKPLAFIKVQTTGLNPNTDRIVELSITRVETDGKVKTGTRLVNPGMPIPSDVTKINGITDEMVKSKPTFKEIAENINKFLEGCDFVGFNIAFFDLKFLSEEFNKAGVEFTLLGRKVVDIANIYHAMEPRDLAAAYGFYCGKTAEKQNSEGTTQMYFEILNNMMEKYSGKEYTDKTGEAHKIESTVESVNNLFNKNKKQLDIEGNIVLNDANRPVFTKGKYKDQVVSEALLKDKDYYEWLVDVSTFPADTKLVIKKIVEKAKAAAIAK
jgi:DNA polymerase III subunit epsilon